MTSRLPSSTDMDLERFRLRRFLESLRPRRAAEVEAADRRSADVAGVLEGNAKAVWFERAGPERAALAGNVAGSRSRLALRVRHHAAAAAAEVLRASAKPQPEIVEVSKRARARRSSKPDPDLTALAGASAARLGRRALHLGVDRFHASIRRRGLTNVGIRRLMLRGRARGRHRSHGAARPARDLSGARRSAASALPIAFVVGSHPIDHVAATMRMPARRARR